MEMYWICLAVKWYVLELLPRPEAVYVKCMMIKFLFLSPSLMKKKKKKKTTTKTKQQLKFSVKSPQRTKSDYISHNMGMG